MNVSKILSLIKALVPKKLSDIENDLWYTKRETLVNLTLEDFTADKTGMLVHEMDKVNLANSDKFGYQISFTTTEGVSLSGTETDLGDFVVDTYGNGTIWINEPLLVIANGLGRGETGYIEVDKCTVYLSPDLTEVNLTLEIIKEKKIPIEYCDTSEIEAEIDEVNGEVI